MQVFAFYLQDYLFGEDKSSLLYIGVLLSPLLCFSHPLVQWLFLPNSLTLLYIFFRVVNVFVIFVTMESSFQETAGYQVSPSVLGGNEPWWKNPSTRKDECMPDRPFVLLNFSLDGLSYPKLGAGRENCNLMWNWCWKHRKVGEIFDEYCLEHGDTATSDLKRSRQKP